MTSALYGQDSYSIGRLNVIAGLRWERVEGYLPAQTAPDSRYFPGGLVFQGVNIGGVIQNYTVKKQFDPVRDNPLWHNVAPRIAGTYDLFGNGKTAVKVSWGKYLDQISTGTPPNPNSNINQTYVWNDLNGDFIFQPGNATWDGLKYVGGEFGNLNSTSNLAVAAFDRSLRRPYRNELTVTLDHELFKNFLLDVSFLHTREHDTQGTIDNSIDLWPSQYTQIPVTDPGRDGIAGTSDDQQLTVYSQNAGVTTTTKTINDDRLATRYNGLDIVATKRFEQGWTLLAGYTYSHTRVDLVSLSNPNNAFVNAGGESGGRRHNFKASGSYTLPYKVLVAANLRLQSGLPITRTWTVPTCSASVDDQLHPAGADGQRRAARLRRTARPADARHPGRPVLRLPPGPSGPQLRRLQPDQRQHGVQYPHRNRPHGHPRERRPVAAADAHHHVPVADAVPGAPRRAHQRDLQLQPPVADRRRQVNSGAGIHGGVPAPYNRRA